MDIRTAITAWAGAGAAENARRSLEEWSRAQDEVSQLLTRLATTEPSHRAPESPTTAA
jgi:hypothetical protein